jgi:hypothetical protein
MLTRRRAGGSNMRAARRIALCLGLAAELLAAGCAGASPGMPESRPPDFEVLKSARVREAGGGLSFLVKDVLIDERTGEISYLVVAVEPSGFNFDPRTAPLVDDESVLVPWKLIRFDPAQGKLFLTVDADAVLNAPRPLEPSGHMSGSAWAAVEQYWTSIRAQ